MRAMRSLLGQMSDGELGQKLLEGDRGDAAGCWALEAELLEAWSADERCGPGLRERRFVEREVERRIVGDRERGSLVEPRDEGECVRNVARAVPVARPQELFLTIEPPGGRCRDEANGVRLCNAGLQVKEIRQVRDCELTCG